MIWVIVGAGDLQLYASISPLGLVSIDLIVVMFGIRIAVYKPFDARLRRGWLLISLGIAASTIAEAFWLIYGLFHLTPLPFITDILYVAYYPLVLAGLLSLPYTPVKLRDRIIFILDISIVAVSCTMLMWASTLNPLLALVKENPLSLLVIAYPAGNVLLFAGVAALLPRDIEAITRQTLLFLALGLGFNAVGEALFVYCRLFWMVWTLPYLYILYLMGALSVLVAAAWQAYSGRGYEVPSIKLHAVIPILRLIIPYGAVLVGWGLLIIMTFTSAKPDLRLQGILMGALLLVGLVLLRQYNLLQENVHLYMER